jgi:predicted nucleic acid-binding Zn ribbon protein
MAIYEYEIIGADGHVRGIYEAEQKMSDAALTQHPVTGEKLRRILSRTFTRAESTGSSDCATGTCGLGDYGTGGGCASGMCGLS